jgi:hyperosmotically inducible periplasmic protein
MIQRHSLTAASLAVAAAALLACSPGDRATASPAPYASPSGDAVDKARAEASEAGRDIKEGAEKAGDAIKEGAEKAGDAIKEAAQDVKENTKPAAQDAGAKVKEGAQKTGSAVDAGKQHVDVKAALLADASVDASHIDVDVNKDTKTLYLRGTVPTAAQKAQAERIAKDKAEGFSVRNELTVMAKK